MEFKEIRTKRKLVVLCKIEDLLLEATESKTVEEAESKVKRTKGEMICHCPFCRKEGHTKHRLYIKDDFSVGHCFVCERSFRNVTDEVDTSFTIPSFNFGSYIDTRLVMPEITDEDFTLDCFKYDFEDYSEEGVKYLANRHIFLKELYKVLDIKFDECGNPVIPFKFHEDIIYYQIRNRKATKENGKWRYLFPETKSGQKPPYILEHGENKQFILCEGVFDAMSLLIQAPNYTPVALGGHSISDYQLKFLRDYVPQKIVIYMDETKLSYDVMRQVLTQIDYCPIDIIPSSGEDPEERLKRYLTYGKTLQELAWIK